MVVSTDMQSYRDFMFYTAKNQTIQNLFADITLKYITDQFIKIIHILPFL